MGNISYFQECNWHKFSPRILQLRVKTVLTRFPLPPDSLAAQRSQVDKFCSLSSFLSPPPPSLPQPPFRTPKGNSRDYILDGTNLQSLLQLMHSMYQYFLMQVDLRGKKKKKNIHRRIYRKRLYVKLQMWADMCFRATSRFRNQGNLIFI